MTDHERDQFRQQLLGLGKRMKEDVTGLEDEAFRKSGGGANGNLSNTPFHLADLGSDNYEQEVTVSLLENEEQRLEEIAAALDRINNGTFGRCEECQQEIGIERLCAIPYTRHCVECARKAQEQQPQSVQNPGNL